MNTTNPIITTVDSNTLKSLLSQMPKHEKTRETGLLINELEKAEIVPEEAIGNDVIRLNSYFEVEELQSKKLIRLTLTLPRAADLRQGKISVFSPLGVALIGYRQGMELHWNLPGGQKKLKILKVINE